MRRQLLETTTTAGLLPLGSVPQRSWELITGALRDRLGEDAAALFAEPVSAEHGDRIDWYAPRHGLARRFPELTVAERDVARRQLAGLTANILAEAARLRDVEDPDSLRLAEALANAVEIPSEDKIHVISEAETLHPVLVHWAWLEEAGHPVRGVLTGMIPRAAPLSPSSGPAASVWTSPVWWWLVVLGWILLAGLLALILWLMLRPCGLAPWGPDYCADEPAALSAAYSEQAVLEDRVAALQRELALSVRVCQPVVPIRPAIGPPEAAPERKGALPSRERGALRRLAGQAGSLYSRSTAIISRD